METVKPSAEIEDEIDLHKTGWVVQRIGWIILILLLIASALGLFGTGMLSDSQASGEIGLVKFERFCRFEFNTELVVHVENPQSLLTIRFPEAYFNDMKVDKIHPAPSAQRIDNGYLIYEFANPSNIRVKFYLVPQSLGRINAQVILNDEPYSIYHFVYP